MAMGGGHVPLSESMAVLGIPSLSKRALMSTEKCIVVGSSQGINETSWGGRKGDCYVSPRDTTIKVYQPLQ